MRREGAGGLGGQGRGGEVQVAFGNIAGCREWHRGDRALQLHPTWSYHRIWWEERLRLEPQASKTHPLHWLSEATAQRRSSCLGSIQLRDCIRCMPTAPGPARPGRLRSRQQQRHFACICTHIITISKRLADGKLAKKRDDMRRKELVRVCAGGGDGGEGGRYHRSCSGNVRPTSL